MILDWKKIAWEIYDDLKNKIQKIDTPPTLWVILVWDSQTPSLRYIDQKKKFSEKVGINFILKHVNENISEKDLIAEVEKFNNSDRISWYIIQLPLPKHIDSLEVTKHIDPKKDLDGFHPLNQGKIMIWDTSWFAPCTPAGIMKIFSYYNIELSGKKVVVLWRSNIVGKPVMNMLVNSGATVSSCNSQTPNISEYTKNADIIISATGQAGIISANMVHKNAVIIDVGFSVLNEKLVWDCDYDWLIAQGNSITPVPWGVGPMTVAMLMNNAYFSHIQNDTL